MWREWCRRDKFELCEMAYQRRGLILIGRWIKRWSEFDRSQKLIHHLFSNYLHCTLFTICVILRSLSGEALTCYGALLLVCFFHLYLWLCAVTVCGNFCCLSVFLFGTFSLHCCLSVFLFELGHSVCICC